MKKLGFIACAVGLFSAISALASMSGNWFGNGSLTTQANREIRCESAKITIHEDGKRFELREFRYSCDGMQVSFEPIHAEIKDGELHQDGQVIGSYHNTRVTLQMLDPNSGATLSFDIQTFANQMVARQNAYLHGVYNSDFVATLQR